MKKHILSWLLYHANKSKNVDFYPIKNCVLSKYGRKTDTVVQFIKGKKCFSCGGTGNHTYYDWNGFAFDHAPCWDCSGTGWYKRSRWNWLDVVRFGKYSFHQPIATTYEEPSESMQQFEGYIEHNNTKYTEFALFTIFLLYEPGFLKRWWRIENQGWRLRWWLPCKWRINTIHIIKNWWNTHPIRKRIKFNYSDDDLPF